MSGAMHTLGIVVGFESAWLRVSEGCSIACSPFVQRKVYLPLTISDKAVSARRVLCP